MATISKSSATLRVMGDLVDPQEISALLGRDPDAGHRKGDKRYSGGLEYTWPSGSWRLKAEDRTPGDLDAQVMELLAGLTQYLDTWNHIASKHNINLFCGLFMEGTNEGLSISAATLTALGTRGIEIGFDVYAPSDDEQFSSGAGEASQETPSK